MIDPTQTSPALPQGHPFTIFFGQGIAYWSATTNAENSAHAWFVAFAGGAVGFTDKPAEQFVWCVRGGMNAEAY